MDSISIPVTHYLIFNSTIFSLSIAGIIINYNNLLTLLMSIELMYLSINTNFITFSSLLKQSTGNIFVFFILTVAAAETAIALAIIVVVFRNYKTINPERFYSQQGHKP